MSSSSEERLISVYCSLSPSSASLATTWPTVLFAKKVWFSRRWKLTWVFSTTGGLSLTSTMRTMTTPSLESRGERVSKAINFSSMSILRQRLKAVHHAKLILEPADVVGRVGKDRPLVQHIEDGDAHRGAVLVARPVHHADPQTVARRLLKVQPSARHHQPPVLLDAKVTQPVAGHNLVVQLVGQVGVHRLQLKDRLAHGGVLRQRQLKERPREGGRAVDEVVHLDAAAELAVLQPIVSGPDHHLKVVHRLAVNRRRHPQLSVDGADDKGQRRKRCLIVLSTTVVGSRQYLVLDVAIRRLIQIGRPEGGHHRVHGQVLLHSQHRRGGLLEDRVVVVVIEHPHHHQGARLEEAIVGEHGQIERSECLSVQWSHHGDAPSGGVDAEALPDNGGDELPAVSMLVHLLFAAADISSLSALQVSIGGLHADGTVAQRVLHHLKTVNGALKERRIVRQVDQPEDDLHRRRAVPAVAGLHKEDVLAGVGLVVESPGERDLAAAAVQREDAAQHGGSIGVQLAGIVQHHRVLEVSAAHVLIKSGHLANLGKVGREGKKEEEQKRSCCGGGGGGCVKLVVGVLVGDQPREVKHLGALCHRFAQVYGDGGVGQVRRVVIQVEHVYVHLNRGRNRGHQTYLNVLQVGPADDQHLELPPRRRLSVNQVDGGDHPGPRVHLEGAIGGVDEVKGAVVVLLLLLTTVQPGHLRPDGPILVEVNVDGLSGEVGQLGPDDQLKTVRGGQTAAIRGRDVHQQQL
ncbi:hypothetical protein TYRP_002677 [Tyrophagus putrescentiae]|nr:hypothetical protein TYRP_002677 [Tyrophagus putrescentiae]